MTMPEQPRLSREELFARLPDFDQGYQPPERLSVSREDLEAACRRGLYLADYDDPNPKEAADAIFDALAAQPSAEVERLRAAARDILDWIDNTGPRIADHFPVAYLMALRAALGDDHAA